MPVVRKNGSKQSFVFFRQRKNFTVEENNKKICDICVNATDELPKFSCRSCCDKLVQLNKSVEEFEALCKKVVKPFKCAPLHEPYPSFPEMLKSVREKINLGEFFRWLERHKTLLARGLPVVPENEESESSDADH